MLQLEVGFQLMDLLIELHKMSIIHTLRREGRRFGINETSPPAYNPIVVNWQNRVVNGGGPSPSIATLNILNTFYNGLVSNGLDTLMVNVNCFVPDSLQAALTPLIATSGNGSPSGTNVNSWVNVNFISTDLSVNGLKGNGSTKYLNSGVIPSNCLGAQSAGVTIYNTFSEVSTNVDFGANNGNGNSQIMLILNYTGPGAFFDVYSDSSGRINGSAALAGGVGYTSGNRTNSTTSYLYKATSVIAHTSFAGPGGTNTASAPSRECYFYIYNSAGSPAGTPVAKQFSFAAIHFGLTSAQSSIFFNLIQAMRTSLGGGYV